MKQFLAASLIACSPLFLAPATAHAEETEEGLSLMEEGAKLFLKGIMEEMAPAMEGLRGLADDMEPAMRQFVQEMGPALRDLIGKIDDLSTYHPPEMLPNGDIIMRKKTPEEMGRPQGEIEL